MAEVIPTKRHFFITKPLLCNMQPQQVNNAGVLGSGVKAEDRKNFSYSVEDITGPNAVSQKKFVNQTYEITASCLRTNYYGTKHLTEALIPILEQSSSARIVNVSSTLGKLKLLWISINCPNNYLGSITQSEALANNGRSTSNQKALLYYETSPLQHVNNAGITGSEIKEDDWKKLRFGEEDIIGVNAASQRKLVKQTYEMSISCLRTNYYGIKHLTEALIPILEQSNSARIVNVSSSFGKLKKKKKKKWWEAGAGAGAEEHLPHGGMRTRKSPTPSLSSSRSTPLSSSESSSLPCMFYPPSTPPIHPPPPLPGSPLLPFLQVLIILVMRTNLPIFPNQQH
ncbi:hypothetical protein NC651_012000 [Populus alba x Populus x berolinensis]|nr:hypothetical protein NC651_012000 [Populus alba x Populus x berolinensis]